MNPAKTSLFEAFHADHATLGRGFHELSQSIRGNDFALARSIAERIDSEAGAHIAFEEKHFYVALIPMLGKEQVGKMLDEHAGGFEVVRALLSDRSRTEWDEKTRAQLLQQSEAMETHIAECGDLFAAMGRIPAEEQATLLGHLLRWRRSKPRWSDVVASPASPAAD